MFQQINLYQDILRGERAVSAATLALWLGVPLALLLFLTGLLFWQTTALRRELGGLQREELQQVAHLAELAKAYPPRQQNQQLAEEVARLAAARDARGPLLQVIEAKSRGNRSGFSGFLEGLARPALAGIWLRRIDIDGGGSRLLLEGRTQEPRLAPRYLQQLAEEQVFAGIEFERLQMTRPTDDPDCIDFTLQTTTGEVQ